MIHKSFFLAGWWWWWGGWGGGRALHHAPLLSIKNAAFFKQNNVCRRIHSEVQPTLVHTHTQALPHIHAQSGRSTIAHRHIIDRIGRIIKSTEPNLTKTPIFVHFGFSAFVRPPASYKAETLTPDRSRAPRRGTKIRIDRPIDRIDRRRPP